MKKLKTGKLYREASVDGSAVDADARTVALAFSSEAPVDRWFGTEVLDHGPGSIRLGRLTDGGPVLVDHDTRDHVGVVEDVKIGSDRVGRAIVRFGRSARAEEIFQDVVDGIRRSVSVGYQIHKMKDESAGGGDIYRAVDWEPMEISMVSVPADVGAQVGRDHAVGDFESEIEERIMENETSPASVEAPSQGAPAPVHAAERAAPSIDIDAEREKIRKAELARIQDMNALGERHGFRELAEQHIKEGKSVDAFRAAILDAQGTAKPTVLRRPESSDIGMSAKEVKRFSFIRAINALANPTDRRAQEAAAYEYECSEAAAERAGKDSQGIMVPSDVLKRDLDVATGGAGQETVATDLLAGNFIELLRNATEVYQRATVLSDLTGNIAIPRQATGGTAYWVAEGNPPTESQQSFDQVTLSPETVGAFTDVSRKLLLQSSIDVEAFIRRDLATILGLEIDRACINGSGTGNEPAGILQTAGIGSVSMGTPDGGVPTWGKIVDLESAVSADNALLGNLAYITNAVARGKLKQTAKDAGSGLFLMDGNSLNGYPVLTTNQVPSNLVEGVSGATLSAIIFGNLADLIVGQWGGLDLMTDPYTASTTGTVRVVVLQDLDIAVRHAESFAAAVDVITV